VEGIIGDVSTTKMEKQKLEQLEREEKKKEETNEEDDDVDDKQKVGVSSSILCLTSKHLLKYSVRSTSSLSKKVNNV
jgi:hypothetical protein